MGYTEGLQCPPNGSKVSISSPSGEGGGPPFCFVLPCDYLSVSISSPSGEGGGEATKSRMKTASFVSINSPSGEGGGSTPIEISIYSRRVSINSPSGEGGGACQRLERKTCVTTFPLILLQAKAGGPLPRAERGSYHESFH